MEYRQKQPYAQIALFSTCLEDMIPKENSVRIIDQFVDSLDLSALGFKTLATQGREQHDCIGLSHPYSIYFS